MTGTKDGEQTARITVIL